MVKKRKKTKKLKKKKKSRRSRLSTYDYEQEERRQLQEYLDNRWGGKEGIPPVIFLIIGLILSLITWVTWKIGYEFGFVTMIISGFIFWYILYSYVTDKGGRTYWDQIPRN